MAAERRGQRPALRGAAEPSHTGWPGLRLPPGTHSVPSTPLIQDSPFSVIQNGGRRAGVPTVCPSGGSLSTGSGLGPPAPRPPASRPPALSSLCCLTGPLVPRQQGCPTLEPQTLPYTQPSPRQAPCQKEPEGDPAHRRPCASQNVPKAPGGGRRQGVGAPDQGGRPSTPARRPGLPWRVGRSPRLPARGLWRAHGEVTRARGRARPGRGHGDGWAHTLGARHCTGSASRPGGNCFVLPRTPFG